jgi:hypothetical protein
MKNPATLLSGAAFVDFLLIFVASTLIGVAFGLLSALIFKVSGTLNFVFKIRSRVCCLRACVRAVAFGVHSARLHGSREHISLDWLRLKYPQPGAVFVLLWM